MFMKTTSIKLGMFFCIFLINCNSATSPASITLGSFLGGLLNQINSVIQQAQTSGLILEVTAGSQVKNLIEETKTAYESSLNKTLDGFSAEERKLFDNLEVSITQVNEGIDNAASHVLAITSTFPLMRRVPQIRKYEGNIVSPNQSTSLRLNGNFPSLGEKNYSAILKIKGQSIKASVTSNQDIEFTIPNNLLKSTKNKITYMPCVIEIDYEKRKFLLFHSREVASFHQSLVILPDQFGTLVIETTSKVDSTLREPGICPNLIWDTHSGSDDSAPKGCTVPPTWTVDVPTVRYVLKAQSGSKGDDWNDAGSVSDINYVGWRFVATTKHGPFGNYGGVVVDLHYEKYRTTQVDKVTYSSSKTLKWGDKIVIDLPAQSLWKLMFTKYDGKYFELASTTQNSPFIRLKNIRGRQLEIQTVPFDL
jgi:hypothetical protein